MELELNSRGAMTLKINELEDFARGWLAAGGQVVQHWEVWEQKAAKFLGGTWSEGREHMHLVMHVVVAICSGTLPEVKRALRDAVPTTLTMCELYFGHIPQFSSVLHAEMAYRKCLLAGDWQMIPDGHGRLSVRTIYRTPTETEH